MAILDITEYDSVTKDSRNDVVLVGQEPCQTNQQLAIGVTSVASAAFGGRTRLVRLHTDAACRINFVSANPSTDPVAAATTQRLAANSTEYFGVRPGWKVAVIQST